jgi:hypothetical protein
VSGRLESRTIGDDQWVRLRLDAKDADLQVLGQDWRKPAGVEAGLQLEARTELDDARREPGAPSEDPNKADGRVVERQHWQLVDSNLQLAGVQVEDCRGTCGTASPDGRGSRSLWRLVHGAAIPRVTSGRVRAQAQVTVGRALASLHPHVGAWLTRHGLQGRAQATIEAEAGTRGARLAGTCQGDALGLVVAWDGDSSGVFHKRPGTPAEVLFDVSVGREADDKPWRITAEELNASLGDNLAGVQGQGVAERGDDGSWCLSDARATGYVTIEDASQLGSCLVLDGVQNMSGRCRLSGEARCGQEGWSLVSMAMDCDALQIGPDSGAVQLDGQALFEKGKAATDTLALRMPGFQGVISGEIQASKGDLAGSIGLVIRELDMPRIEKALRKCMALGDEHLGGEVPGMLNLRSVVRRFGDTRFTVDLNADQLVVELPPSQRVEVECVSGRLAIRKGLLDIGFRGLVDGGDVRGRVVSQTQVSQPRLRLTYQAEGIRPGPVVDNYLRVMFPGMTADGPLTLVEESYWKLFTPAGMPNFGSGRGELIIEGGELKGRAAPLAVTRIFPGLNLARFDFSYMHSWFTIMPSGRVRNQMIFQGRYYNLYMVGHSDPDRRFRYEVGIDLLAEFDSRYWADSGQGRIPLFTKAGRINEQGRLVEERVRYISAERIFEALFVRNNVVITAYHLVRKRVLGEQ